MTPRKILIALTAAVLASAAFLAAPAAYAQSKSYAAGRFVLDIDGSNAGYIKVKVTPAPAAPAKKLQGALPLPGLAEIAAPTIQ